MVERHIGKNMLNVYARLSIVAGETIPYTMDISSEMFKKQVAR